MPTRSAATALSCELCSSAGGGPRHPWQPMRVADRAVAMHKAAGGAMRAALACGSNTRLSNTTRIARKSCWACAG